MHNGLGKKWYQLEGRGLSTILGVAIAWKNTQLTVDTHDCGATPS